MKKRLIKLFLRTPAGRLIRKKFTAGDTLEEGINRVKELRVKGFRSTLAYAGGEQVYCPGKIEKVIETHELMLEKISQLYFPCDIAIKYSQFGLFSDIGGYLYLRNLNWLYGFIKKARQKNVFVWIDAEELEFREKALDITYYIGSSNYYKNGMPGVCIQVQPKDSLEFSRKVIDIGLSVRVCKGAYNEDPQKVVTEKDQIHLNFYFLFLRALEGKSPKIQVATHDSYLRWAANGICEKLGKQYSKTIEFGSLLGRHKEKGDNVYVLFGPETEDYLARRFIESPQKCLSMIHKK